MNDQYNTVEKHPEQLLCYGRAQNWVELMIPSIVNQDRIYPNYCDPDRSSIKEPLEPRFTNLEGNLDPAIDIIPYFHLLLHMEPSTTV